MAVLCADIGTSSLKTALVDMQGQVLAQSRIRFPKAAFNQEALCPTGCGPNPCCSQKLFCGECWVEALVQAATQLHKDQPAERIEGICISGNGPTLATTSGKIFLWNHPVEAGLLHETQQELARQGLPSLFLPRLLLFRKLFPREWAESERIISGPEYLIWRLTGRFLTILPERRFLPAYWNEESLEKLGIETAKLPDFAGPATKAGELLPHVAAQLALPATTPVFCGGPDFTVALIGTNTLEPGRICDRAGSSEGINLCLAENPGEAIRRAGIEGIRVLPSVVPGLFNASVLIPDSGTRFSTFKKAHAPQLSYQQFVQLLLDDPASNKEGFLLLEKLATQVKAACEKLCAVARLTGTEVAASICTTGGQAKNPRWLQYKSEVVGAGFSTTACADAELVGDAVLAYCGLGKYGSVQEGSRAMVRLQHLFEPRKLRT